MNSVIPSPSELKRIQQEKGKLGIDDILGNGFTESMSSAIKEARKERRLEAHVEYDFFVENLLPVIAGKVEDKDILQKWTAWLGGSNVTANIVRNGELYLVIPPIDDKLQFNISDHRIPPKAAFEEYSRLAEVNEAAATRNLLTAVQGWHKEYTLEQLYLDYSKWNEIFVEHGYEPRDLSNLELIIDKEKLASLGGTVSAVETKPEENIFDNEEW